MYVDWSEDVDWTWIECGLKWGRGLDVDWSEDVDWTWI